MSVTLISNSGIQFHKFTIDIDPNQNLIKSIGFWEKFNASNARLSLEYAVYLSERDIWVSKRSLIKEDFIDSAGKLSDSIDYSVLRALDETTEFHSVNDILSCLELYENQWLPVPFFRCSEAGDNVFGPTNWSRLFLKPVSNGDSRSRIKSYEAVLAFDTTFCENDDKLEVPYVSENSNDNLFTMCRNEDLILNYCDSQYKCGWVEEYLVELVHGNRANVPSAFPSLRYLARYIYLVRYLSELQSFPQVELFTDRNQPVDVNLVLDIGNSNTCGLLFEEPQGKSFDFTSAKKLKINDLTDWGRSYSEPFSMQLAFSKCSFGDIGYNSSRFQWPSILRVGEEAGDLISSSFIDTERGIETATFHSSPKRYLWDDSRSRFQWEYTRSNGGRVPNPVYLRGISEQFSSNGELTLNVDFGAMSHYSRKSLMTFVYIEILAHALTQINSHDFRLSHGNINRPRRLRRLIITCPTAMAQKEQVAIRKCAEDAAIALKRYYSNTFEVEVDMESLGKEMELIPSVRDLGRDMTQFDKRRDWIYDEATCCQLVFMYGEVSKRYLNDCDLFFNLYGKYRADLEGYNKKSVTIGSVDIGGGTTDLMICSYQYEGAGLAVLTPKPLYWDSFNLAGDDFKKEIIRQIILEGRIADEYYRGCVGVIENHARKLGIGNIKDLLIRFFGTDSNNIDYIGRVIRKNFNSQVLVPIANRYLQHAESKLPDMEVSFKELMSDNYPNQELLNHFRRHFGFGIEEIKWKLSEKRVNEILESTLEPLLRQISAVLYAMGCDFVLLAGKPTSLGRIEDLFLKFYPVSPDRIITLRNYRVGRWYPFSDDSGYFKDPKTLVSVGAMISLMGGRLDNLAGFRINLDLLKTEITSTADFVGVFNPNTKNTETIMLNPDKNRGEFQVAGLPVSVGCRRLAAENYPGRPLYQLDFNDAKIRERVANQYPQISAVEIPDYVEQMKVQLKSRMPFSVLFSRQYRDNKEAIKIESILDRDRSEISNSLLSLSLKTLSDETAYWLDTGEFQLSVRD